MPTKSGMFWVSWANENATASKSVDDLAEPFRTSAKAFITALRDADDDISSRGSTRTPSIAVGDIPNPDARAAFSRDLKACGLG